MIRLSRLQRLFLGAAILPPANASVAWGEWTQHGDLQRMDSESNSFVCSLYRNLQRAGVETEFAELLKGNYRYHWTQNQVILKEVREALGVLSAQGIETCLGRDLAMVLLYHGDLGVRPLSLVDLCFRGYDAEQAMKSLSAAGWLKVAPSMIARPGAPAIAIQRWLYPACPNDKLDALTWARTKEFSQDGIACKALDAADEFLRVAAAWRQSRIGGMRTSADAWKILSWAGESFGHDLLMSEAAARQFVSPARQVMLELDEMPGIELNQSIGRQWRRVRPGWIERLELPFVWIPWLRRFQVCFATVRAEGSNGWTGFCSLLREVKNHILQKVRSLVSS